MTDPQSSVADLDTEIDFQFQWQVGDLRPVEANAFGFLREPWRQILLIVSRVAAFGLVFFTTDALLGDADLIDSLVIAFAGSLSLWVSWGVAIIGKRVLENRLAAAPHQVDIVQVRISRDGIRWASELSETYTSWFGVVGIEQPSGAIWLKTGERTGFFFPARLFSDPTVHEEVLAAIDRFRSSPLVPSHRRETPLASQVAQ